MRHPLMEIRMTQPVYIATWKDTSHEGDDDGKQWVAEVIEYRTNSLDIDPEIYETFGWHLTEEEAVSEAVKWCDEHSDEYILRA